MVSRWDSSSLDNGGIDEVTQPGFREFHGLSSQKTGSGELAQETQIAFEEQAQVIDAIAQHGQAVRAQAEGEADVFFRVDTGDRSTRSDGPCRNRRFPASGPSAHRS